MTAGSPPSTTATTEFVVPRSMPITFAMSCSLLSECLDHAFAAGGAGAIMAPAPNRPRCWAALDRLDLDLLRLDLLDLRELHGQYAVPIRRLDLPALHRHRQRERALELAEPALPTIVARVLDLPAPPTLALDREQVTGDGEVDVLFAESRQLRADHHLVLGLVHVRGGRPHALRHSGRGRLAHEVVEKPVHLRLDISEVARQVLCERPESN